MIRPGWSTNGLFGASVALQEGEQVLSEVQSGSQQHGLPIAWPITEADIEATYLAGLDNDDDEDTEKKPVSAAGKGETGGDEKGAEGADDDNKEEGSTAPMEVTEEGEATAAGGAVLSSSSSSSELKAPKAEGGPAAVEDRDGGASSSKRQRRRGPRHVCDGRLILDLVRDEIEREKQAFRYQEAKHREFKNQLQYTQKVYEYGLRAVQAVCASGNFTEEANAMLSQVVTKTVRCLRGGTPVDAIADEEEEEEGKQGEESEGIHRMEQDKQEEGEAELPPSHDHPSHPSLFASGAAEDNSGETVGH